MGIVELVLALLIVYLLYKAFIHGLIMLFAVCGFFGGRYFLLNNFDNTSETFMTVQSYDVSWAAFISFVVVFVGMCLIYKRME